MRHIIALAIKAMMVILVSVFVLSMFNGYPFLNTTLLALIITGAAYIIGDIFILRATNNTVATISDIGLCTIAIWLIGPIVYGIAVPFSVALLTGVIIGAGEWFFHKFMSNAVFEKDERLVGGH
ncbi:DUF2512 family protein [Evansella cellulosilytica]|uniref:DUF2512 family protein n=1 Tax=Evansella cellulosilytica (strain ATCC 21833 / DSM 2522 / FERM P-1141 / JCM 9156 / N-4) TaxID=649639 RepID=E6TVY4_EVAC2|nr:DUF2512 family protein [Evansella cellulosilytica]ADU28693.1 Protein of unknown function DUF2512 [Evansella cellulosilytica DSM 2522]